MKNRFLRLLCGVLLLLTVLSSCGGTPAEEITTPAEEETTEAPAPETPKIRLTKDGKACCAVVRPDEAPDDVVEIAKNVRDRLQDKIQGVKFSFGYDYVLPGKKRDTESYEILIGDTTYDETASVKSRLRYLDYAVEIVGHKLVVAAGNDARLDAAVTQFMSVLSKNTEKDENGDYWLIFDPIRFEANYKVKDLKIAGKPFTDYRIVYSKDYSMASAAAAVADILANATGYRPEIVTDKEAEQECEILIGRTNRLEVATDAASYAVYTSGSKLVFACNGAISADAASKKLYSDFLFAGGNVSLDSSLRLEGAWSEDVKTPLAEGADLRIMSFNILTEKWGGTDTAPRAELLGLVLDCYRPDAVGIQEVCSIWRKVFPTYGGDYKMICTVLPNGGENYSCILYDSSRYDVLASGAEAYSVTCNVLCRNMGWAIFQSKTGDGKFGLISTHWDFDATDANRDNYRAVQADELAAKVAALEKEYGCPIFTTGDYNCKQNSKSMTYFREINKMWCSWFDAEKKLNDYGSASSLGQPVGHGGNSIDFVFGTQDNSRCLTSQIVVDCRTQDISDHRPVVADIQLLR